MNAFIQVIAQLVEAIPESVWLAQRFFPFRDLMSPRGHLFDACVFRQGAFGALGFLWVGFDGKDEILTLPFRLARHSEDGDLITLPPWSLREASGDGELFEAWRRAIHSRNPLLTAREGGFSHRFCNGEPALLALGIWSDSRNACVRLESQEAYKIFRTFSPRSPDAFEVEILEFLTQQNVFQQFPRLVSVYEYSHASIQKADIAISTKYIQNSGTLWQDLASRIQQARYPRKMHERSAAESWAHVMRVSEHLGRLFGDFHKAMTLARENPNLMPESNTGAAREEWMRLTEHKLDERLSAVIHLAQQHGFTSDRAEDLRACARALLLNLRSVKHLGLLIRTHGHAHLGQILLSGDQLYLIDFEADEMDDWAYRNAKQPSLKDVASLILSLRYGWLLTDRESESAVFVDFLDPKSEFGRHVGQSRENHAVPQTYAPTLEALESNLLRFYVQTVLEDSNASELIPRERASFEHLYRLCFFMRVLKEIIRDFSAGNPRFKLGLRILDEFTTPEGMRRLHESVPDYV